MPETPYEFLPDAILADDTTGHVVEGAEPFCMDGIMYFPCSGVSCGFVSKDDDAMWPIIMVSRGAAGFFQEFTPEGAVAFAGKVLEAATLSNEKAARLAAELLATIAGKPA